MAKQTVKTKAVKAPAKNAAPLVKPVQTKAQTKRVVAAFEGKNMRKIVHEINNDFPLIRTGDLNNTLLRMLRGDVFNEELLVAVEALDITEEVIE